MTARTSGISTREDWLILMASQLESLFGQHDYSVPDNYRVTCGFPSSGGLGKRKRAIGECWDAERSEGQVFEIFISPLLDDPMDVTATLAHELIHATVGLKAKHGARFKKCMTAIGLEGKATATQPGQAFQAWARPVIDALGPYPHQKLNPRMVDKKQTTRMRKIECPDCRASGEPYILRGAGSTIERGLPICPIHGTAMVAENGEEADDDGS